jgi:hypothetical protein
MPGRPLPGPSIYSFQEEIAYLRQIEILGGQDYLMNNPDYTIQFIKSGDLTGDRIPNAMRFPKPGRVVAYELKSTWDGKGTAPSISSDSRVQLNIGEDLRTFANRHNSEISGWKLMGLWIVYAPFKWEEIYGSEQLTWP